MSYDEQPDGDIHGECALEINMLKKENDRLRAHIKHASDDSYNQVYEAWKSGQVSVSKLDKRAATLRDWHLAAIQVQFRG